MKLSELVKSKAATNQALKGLTISDIEKLIVNINSVAHQLKKQEAAREKKREAAAVKKLQAMMSDMDLTPEDVAKLAGAATKKQPGRKPGAKKSTGKVPPKYQITVDGKTHTWTGRGRTPVVFREHVENGGSLEDCLIK